MLFQNEQSGPPPGMRPAQACQRRPPTFGSWPATVAGYLFAGRLLHAIAMAQLCMILAVACCADPHPLRIPCLAWLGLLAIFTQLDARSRYQEYKKARDQLIEHGPDRRIFQSLSGSRCQRDTVLAAANELGHATACRNHFAAAGYRWYHLLPDFVSHHPCFLFSPAFIKATFFVPTYRSRYSGIENPPRGAGSHLPPQTVAGMTVRRQHLHGR